MARGRSRSGQSAIDDVRAAYDEAPYEAYAHPQSAPGQLAAIAWAFGLDPPDVARSRVLELVVRLQETSSHSQRPIRWHARWASICRRFT
ncbi:MAG: hypothetical protein QOD36_4072 [Mycobacterium sp.]|nr:hypothetical protein [Mycobacterium sp.]